jgi:hypothetical protein
VSREWSVHLADDEDWSILEGVGTDSERCVGRFPEQADAERIADLHNRSLVAPPIPASEDRRFQAAMHFAAPCLNQPIAHPQAFGAIFTVAVRAADELLAALARPKG